MVAPHVQLSIASPSEIEHTARQLTAVRERFLSAERLNARTARPMILDSWQRCGAMRIDPLQRYARSDIARDVQLRERFEANTQLMRAADPVMRHLADVLADSGYVVVLADVTGCILTVIGDARIRRKLTAIDFMPGGSWSERSAGTNAIGTALADGHVVQLMAAEHYCDGWQNLTCTAAPIRHPLTSRIIGVLDVTGDYRLIRSHLTSLLATAALEIEHDLRLRLAARPSGTRLQVGTDRFSGDKGPLHMTMNDRVGCETPIRAGRAETESDRPVAEDVGSLPHAHAQHRRDAVYLIAAGGAVNASLDVRVTVERVAEETAHLLRLHSAATGLFEDAGEHVTFHVWSRQNTPRSASSLAWEEILGPSEAVSLVRQRGEPVIIDDVRASTLVPATLVERLGIHALALLPLTGARGIIGFVVAPRPAVHHWEIDDVRLGAALAVQAATAIENSRLFDTLQRHSRRTEAFNAMARLLGTLLDPSRHLDVILERIGEILDLPAGLLLLSDESAGLLTLAAHRGLAETLIEDLREHPMRIQDSRIMATGEALLIRDVRDDERIMPEMLRTASPHDWMVTPLAAAGAVLGVLCVSAHGARTLTNEDLGVCTAIGRQFGLALRNAQLMRATSDMEALRQADRLKSAFLAAVTHDLRSPLTAIRASIDGLLDQSGTHPVLHQEQLLHNIAGQAGRLSRQVDQLLDLSQIEAGALRLDRDWVEAPALIADAVTSAAGWDDPRRIEQNVPADTPLLFVDYERILQVLCNLLENAFKYTPAGSPLAIEVSWTGSTVLIAVADRGPGIPAMEREAIFQSFYRVESNLRVTVRGTGLGLAICRGVMEAHGGRIWVEDRPDGGSVFRLTLPVPGEIPGQPGMSE